MFTRSRIDVQALRSVVRRQPLPIVAAVFATFVRNTLILEALRTAPVSYVVATRQLSVIFAVGLAMIWLREQPSRTRLLGAALTVAGVAVIGLLGG